MEKLLRILFVMCAIAFVTTATACADDKDDKTGGNDKTTKTGGNDKTAKTGGDYKTVKTPSIFKFTPEAKGVTIDTTKDVYKITINPSLLTYVVPSGTAFGASAFMPIFTVTFTDDKKGFIIPTTDAKAEDLTTTHASDQEAALDTNFVEGVDSNDITHSFLADNNPGFDATEINAEWSTLAPRAAVGGGAAVGGTDAVAGVAGIMTDTKVRVGCKTTITGPKAASFTLIAPANDDNLAIAKGTKTECFFSLVGGNAAAAAAATDAAAATAADAADAADAAAAAAAAAATAAATVDAADVAAAAAADVAAAAAAADIAATAAAADIDTADAADVAAAVDAADAAAAADAAVDAADADVTAAVAAAADAAATAAATADAADVAAAVAAAAADIAVVAAADDAVAVQMTAYKAWAKKVVAAAKDDATKNRQKMGFVGIVTGDATASEITKAAGSLLNADITAATSAKLVKAYTTSFQKVEIVIAVAK